MSGEHGKVRLFESGPPYRVEYYLDLRNDAGNMIMDAVRFHRIREYNVSVKISRGYRPRDVRLVWWDRWLHMGGRMAEGLSSITNSTLDSCYIRCREEVPYVRFLENFVENIKTNPTSSGRISREHFMIPGAYKFLYVVEDRKYWSKDLYDECRLRQNIAWGDPTTACFIGWHNVEYHSMTHEDRKDLYWQIPKEWPAQFECARELSVPNPWVTNYLLAFYKSSGQSHREEVDRVLKLEYTIFYVLRLVRNAQKGIIFNQSDDYRLDHKYEKRCYDGVLFDVSPGVVQILSEVHPFYILESSGQDPVKGFLALRRAQEISSVGGPCVQYEWHTGETYCFEKATATDRDGYDYELPLIYPKTNVNTITRIEDATKAWERFCLLTKGHKQTQARVQYNSVVNDILTNEGHGIESSSLCARRKGRARTKGSATWQARTRPMDEKAQKELDEFSRSVGQLAPETENGGVVREMTGVTGHPPQIERSIECERKGDFTGATWAGLTGTQTGEDGINKEDGTNNERVGCDEGKPDSEWKKGQIYQSVLAAAGKNIMALRSSLSDSEEDKMQFLNSMMDQSEGQLREDIKDAPEERKQQIMDQKSKLRKITMEIYEKYMARKNMAKQMSDNVKKQKTSPSDVLQSENKRLTDRVKQLETSMKADQDKVAKKDITIARLEKDWTAIHEKDQANEEKMRKLREEQCTLVQGNKDKTTKINDLERQLGKCPSPSTLDELKAKKARIDELEAELANRPPVQAKQQMKAQTVRIKELEKDLKKTADDLKRKDNEVERLIGHVQRATERTQSTHRVAKQMVSTMQKSFDKLVSDAHIQLNKVSLPGSNQEETTDTHTRAEGGKLSGIRNDRRTMTKRRSVVQCSSSEEEDNEGEDYSPHGVRERGLPALQRGN